MTERTKDPETYRKMCEPFNGADEANAAIEAFFKDLRDIRKKHRIADVLTAISVTVKYEDGQEGNAMTRCSFGDPLKPLTMAAWLYGQEQADQREVLNKFISGKRA